MEAVAKLTNVPTSPRKMRVVADFIRGARVVKALSILKHNNIDFKMLMAELILIIYLNNLSSLWCYLYFDSHEIL